MGITKISKVSVFFSLVFLSLILVSLEDSKSAEAVEKTNSNYQQASHDYKELAFVNIVSWETVAPERLYDWIGNLISRDLKRHKFFSKQDSPKRDIKYMCISRSVNRLSKTRISVYNSLGGILSYSDKNKESIVRFNSRIDENIYIDVKMYDDINKNSDYSLWCGKLRD